MRLSIINRLILICGSIFVLLSIIGIMSIDVQILDCIVLNDSLNINYLFINIFITAAINAAANVSVKYLNEHEIQEDNKNE